MMASAILDIHCILGPNSKYLIKEMSIVDIDGWASQHWIFKHPRSRENTSKVRAVNMWLYRNYHQLTPVCGDVEYSEIGKIFKSLHFQSIFVKGEEKRRIIEDFLPDVKIHEMGEDLDCPRLDQLHERLTENIHRQPCCLYHKDLNHRLCTYNRVFILLKWFKNNT